MVQLKLVELYNFSKVFPKRVKRHSGELIRDDVKRAVGAGSDSVIERERKGLKTVLKRARSERQDCGESH